MGILVGETLGEKTILRRKLGEKKISLGEP